MHWAAVQGATFHQWQPAPLVLRFIKARIVRQGRSPYVTPTLSLVATALLRHCYGIAPMGTDPHGSNTVAVPW